MSTRNNIMVIDRKHSSKFEEGFSIDPEAVADKAYVNMYMHHDGYPEWQGVQIANWLQAKGNSAQDGQRLTAKLVHDMYYDSCYLQRIGHFQCDIEYIYIIWSGNRDKMYVSCWNVWKNECEFVLKPEKIISKYMVDGYEYTDFSNNQTRYKQGDETLDVISRIEDAKHHAQKLVDLLSQQY
jgi:hypothetical protein